MKKVKELDMDIQDVTFYVPILFMLPNLFQYGLNLSILPQMSSLVQDNFMELHSLTSEDH